MVCKEDRTLSSIGYDDENAISGGDDVVMVRLLLCHLSVRRFAEQLGIEPDPVKGT